MGNLGIDPQTWLEEFFEFEYCSECGGDAEYHDAVPFMGNWFARCKAAYYATPEYDRPDLDAPTPPATEWFWQIGDRWVAVVGDHEENSWWGDEVPPDRPKRWRYPIDQLPPSGTLHWRNARGIEQETEI